MDCHNMIRLSFVLVLAVVCLCEARPHKCEQRERLLAELGVAEDALNRAKNLYLNFDEESQNSSDYSKRNTLLGFIDVSLHLVLNVKKSIPFRSPVKTAEESSTMMEHFSTTTDIILNATEEFPTITDQTLTVTEGFPITMEEPTVEAVRTENVRLPKDCQDWLDLKGRPGFGLAKSGVYQVWPRIGTQPIRVRCDMETDGGGWTVIQRRGNFSQQENFDRDWQDYKNGFGNLERDFWLGNDNIFAITNQAKYSLRMDMMAADGESAYVLYHTFKIENESANYKLKVAGFSGSPDMGDSMDHSNRRQFTTKDRKNDRGIDGNCAEKMKGGFWYGHCAACNPNGLYNPGEGTVQGVTMHYQGFKGFEGLFFMDMKLKRLWELEQNVFFN